MGEQPCMLVNYLYRRDPMPGSIRWHMNANQLLNAPVVRVPGFVEQEGSADQLSVVLAMPCSPSGEIVTETQNEYEDFADEYFSRVHPDQELA